jgi:diguanylate cyclase (GGDEF)-like protein
MLSTTYPNDQLIQIIIVSDNDADRKAVRDLVSKQKDTFVVHEASSTHGLMTMLDTGKFDCAILTPKIGLESGLTIHNIMRTQYPDPPASIMLSSIGDEQTAIKAFRLGFSDYVRKQGSFQGDLVRAILRVTDSKRAERRLKAEGAQLAKLVMRDQLTGMPNRQCLEERLSAMLANGLRHENYCAALMISLNNFTKLNETCGLAVGDRALKAFATKLNATARWSDICGRFDGDNILYLIDRNVSTDAVDHACRRLVEALSFSISIDGIGVSLSVSIGAAIYPIDGRSATELLEAAERALFLAKASDGGYSRACLPQHGRDDPQTAGDDEQASPLAENTCEQVSRQGEGLVVATRPGPIGGPDVSPTRNQRVSDYEASPTFAKDSISHQAFTAVSTPMSARTSSLKGDHRETIQRVATRHRVIKRGLILFNNECSSLSCQIRDLSTHGAQVVVDFECLIPDRCLLRIVESRKTFSAEKRWQRGGNAGLKFL